MIIEPVQGTHPIEWVKKNGLPKGAALFDSHGLFKSDEDISSDFLQGWTLNRQSGQRSQYAMLGLDADDTLSRSLNPDKEIQKQAKQLLEQWQKWTQCDQILHAWDSWKTNHKNMEGHIDDIAVPCFVFTYFSYELGAALEGIVACQTQRIYPILADLYAVRYRAVYLWDIQQQQAWVYAYTQQDADQLKDRLSDKQLPCSSLPSTQEVEYMKTSLDPLCSWQEYEQKFNAIQDLIHHGDVYQINLTVPFKAELPHVQSHHLYHTLRTLNPAPFGSLIQISDTQAILSLSPERLVQWSSQKEISTVPIKGTRPRGTTEDEDQRLQQDLIESRKDHAEHLMIVDLERNDLSRVARKGSVHVPILCQLYSYASVHHLVSKVSAQLNDNSDASDILTAILPGGSITGAPKVRSMQHIQQLEWAPRQVYCGAIGYVNVEGDADFSIPIRTAYLDTQNFYYYAGGGIVADSTAQDEWKEMWTKTKIIMQALQQHFTKP